MLSLKGKDNDIMYTMNDKFTSWINEETIKRGWSYRELGRRLDVSHSYATNIANGTATPDFDTIKRIAYVFQVPTEEVLRKIGYLPRINEEQEKRLTKITDRLRSICTYKDGRYMMPVVEDFVETMYRRTLNEDMVWERRPEYHAEDKKE